MSAEFYVGEIQRFCTEDGPGIRTTVFFKGCPLRCRWCHNPELLDPSFYLHYSSDKCISCGKCIKACPAGVISVKNQRLLIDRERCQRCETCIEVCCSGALYTKSHKYGVEELVEELKKDEAFFRNSGGGVTLSGGEILFNAPHIIPVAEALKKEAINLAVETSGFGSYEELLTLAQFSDCILYDLKHMNEDEHKKYVGVSTELIQDNLKKLAADPVIRKKIIIRSPMVAGVNDDEANIEHMGNFMRDHGLSVIHLLPYHKLGIKKAREMGIRQDEFKTPSEEILLRAKKQLESKGIEVFVAGQD